MIALRIALAFAILSVVFTTALLAQAPQPSPSAPLFQERPFGPRADPTSPPPRPSADAEQARPIPAGWLISGGIVIAAAFLALLYRASRVWRSSNLFDQQYRFPTEHEPALRFGASKTGGHIATISFAKRNDGRSAPARSKPEDT